MSHKNLNAVVPLPVRAAGCDLLNARAEPVARAVDEQVAAALVQLINLGDSAAYALDAAYHAQREAQIKAGVENRD